MHPVIKRKRIYEKPAKEDGYRVLADRLWPRGLKKETAEIDEWAKELSPTPELRKWFNHDPSLWTEFRHRYEKELDTNSAVDDFAKTHRDKKVITLLYAGKDEAHTHVIVLQQYLNEISEKGRGKS